MPTSIHSGIIDLGTTLYGASTDPLDPVTLRDGVANGLLHLADSYGQVRVQWSALASAYAPGQGYHSVPVAADDTWTPGLEVGSWPLRLRADGSSYRLRIRLAGASSDNTTAVKFAVVAYRSGSQPDLGDDAVWVSTTTTSSTPAWLTGTSQGDLASATLLELSAARCSVLTRDVGTIDGVGGNAASVPEARVHVVVWGSSAAYASSNPLLYICSIAEYGGLP